METKTMMGKLIMMVRMHCVSSKLSGIKRKKTVKQGDANVSQCVPFPSFSLSFYCRVLGVHERGGIKNEEMSSWCFSLDCLSTKAELIFKLDERDQQRVYDIYFIIVLIIFSTIFSED